ncbi:MAG: MFS transporter [Phycisphaerae bacterium]|nr:MFS transporter [Phycisphaerae bacterium]
MLPVKNDRGNVFGWCMYDWANSAYATTVLAGLLPVYFAEVVVGRGGVWIAGSHYSATSLWAFAVSAAALLAFLLAPVLGAIADFSNAKKRFLLTFAYTGSLFTILLYFCRSGDVLWTLLFFVIAQFGFISANVFYDAFLPQIVTADRLDRTSGRGYAYGYVGGGLQFAVAMGLIAGHEQLGMTQADAVRVGLILAGLWWAGFTLFTVRFLKEPKAASTLPPEYGVWRRVFACAAVGIERTIKTTRRVRHQRHLVLFLVAFMFYNDGIQTVIGMATIYGKEELELRTTDLMLTLLIIQVVAMVGALLFGWIAGWLGTKSTVMLTLALWSGVVVYAYFIHTVTEFFALGVVVGLVLGGSQALSRSLYSSMIPAEASAEFFGFYTVFSKFSAIWGPLAFGVIRKLSGSARSSIVSLIVFFLVGMILLHFVDERSTQKMENGK